MIHAPRHLGQHFLVSRSVLARIMAAAELAPNDIVLEIGAGTGVLTRAIARKAGTVIAVEKDRALADRLLRALAQEGVRNVRIVADDILRLSPADLGLPDHYVVVANIPYYLTSRLVRRLVEADRTPERMVLMVQREVARRIVARPPAMNLLAIGVQAYADAKVVLSVPRTAFRPMPQVTSALIHIRPQGRNFFHRTGIQPERFFAIVRAAFSGKRKILENTLAAPLGVPKAELARILCAIGLSGRRPQELSLKDWGTLIRRSPRAVVP